MNGFDPTDPEYIADMTDYAVESAIRDCIAERGFEYTAKLIADVLRPGFVPHVAIEREREAVQ